MNKTKLRDSLAQHGFAELRAAELACASELYEARESFVKAWHDLPQDTQMGDGGTYRFRRYSRMLWRRSTGELKALEGRHGIFQTLEDNSLNGGRTRVFEPLSAECLDNAYLRWLVQFDADCLPWSDSDPDQWVVGVHVVRIEARPGERGHSSPEGVHRDSETYTVQHVVARENVKGGVFSAYTPEREPLFHWLQLEPWDSVIFTGETWHSATPIEPLRADFPGYRDIALIDFDPAPDETGFGP